MDGAATLLPQDIITSILKLLPVKSLIRCQCVCKHWKNLIKSPSFIVAHLDHSAQHRPYLLFNSYFIRDHLLLYLVDCEMQIVRIQNIPLVNARVRIVGSSNGLLCLRINSYGYGKSPPSLLLWNPAFREVRQVPTTFAEYSDCYVGFGFSPIVNDYKIVRLNRLKYKIHLAEVYSLGIGSWKEIEIGNLRDLILTGTGGFNMNGAIFWVGFNQYMGEPRQYVIVKFDIAMEVFALIPVPALELTCGVRVTEFEHRLAILCSTRNYGSCSIELLVLEQGTRGWVKKYTSNPYPCWLRPITIRRNEIACINESPEHVDKTVISNFTSAELKVLFHHRHSIFNYVESLVPVGNMQVEES